MKRSFKFAAYVACLLAASAVPAGAVVSAWSHSEGGRMRMAALSVDAGKITAILEIEPSAGWKTYWRDPGDAGLPPDITLAEGGNLRLLTVSYPTPEIGRDEGGRFYGYHAPVSLVLELERSDPDQDSVLSASVLVGLCKDICLPFQATFTLPLGDVRQPQADEFMKIQMAKANLPEAPSDSFRIADAGLTADKAFVEMTMVNPGDQTPELAVAPSRGVLLGGKPEITRKDGKTRIRYTVRRLPSPLKDAYLTVLAKAAGRAIETTLAIE